MDISLKPEYEKMVRERVETGAYKTASAVVEEGLRLLEDRDNCGMTSAELRDAIQIGLDELERGEFTSYSSAEEMKADILRQVMSEIGQPSV